MITRSLHDVDVNVRRSTAVVLHETAELVFDPRSVPWLVLVSDYSLSQYLGAKYYLPILQGISHVFSDILFRCASVL